MMEISSVHVAMYYILLPWQLCDIRCAIIVISRTGTYHPLAIGLGPLASGGYHLYASHLSVV